MPDVWSRFLSILTIKCVGCALLLALPLSILAETRLLADGDLLAALKQGGHSLYFRHVATDWSQYDQVKEVDDWRSCDGSRMRQLSEAGRNDARLIGSALRELQVPIAEVLASPYCRTVETAKLMRLGEVRETLQVMNLRAAGYVGGRSKIIADAQALFATAPASGNRVIVAHGNVAREATPAYPDEGEMLVLTADGEGGFILHGRIAIDDWPRLLQLDR